MALDVRDMQVKGHKFRHEDFCGRNGTSSNTMTLNAHGGGCMHRCGCPRMAPRFFRHCRIGSRPVQACIRGGGGTGGSSSTSAPEQRLR